MKLWIAERAKARGALEVAWYSDDEWWAMQERGERRKPWYFVWWPAQRWDA